MDEPLRYRCEVELDGTATTWDFLKGGVDDALRLKVLRVTPLEPQRGGAARWLLDLSVQGTTVFDAHGPNWDADIAGRVAGQVGLVVREVLVYTWDHVDQFPGRPYVLRIKGGAGGQSQ